MSRVDIVIVSWNVRDEVLACLRSLGDTTNAQISIWVVDNASADGTVRAILEAFPEVTVIAREDNVGFAAASNQGIMAGTAPLVFLLNPDTLVPAGAVAELAAALNTLPAHAAVVPRLANEDGSPQTSAFPFESLMGSFLWATGLARILPSAQHRYSRINRWQDERAQDIDWALGAAILIRRDALERVSLMEVGYGMYAEDIDLCRQLQIAGYRVRVLPWVTITHIGGRSTDERFGSRREIEIHRSSSRYVGRYHDQIWVKAWHILQLIGLIARALRSLVHGGPAQAQARTLMALIGLHYGRLFGRPPQL